MITIKTSIYSMLIITISAACRLRVEPAVDRAWARNLHPWTIHAHATNGTTEAVPQRQCMLPSNKFACYMHAACAAACTSHFSAKKRIACTLPPKAYAYGMCMASEWKAARAHGKGLDCPEFACYVYI